ncbi:MAG: MarR family winged helix-turn-helix transcriptional regulator [Pseudomonadales bacterium]
MQTDHETRVHEDDHHSIKLWLRMLTCSSLIESQLRRRLREEFDMTLPRFDFMAQLHRVPEGLTMGALSQRMMVSGGNVSGIANQLIKQGYISRTTLAEDRRTFVVKLSAKGTNVFTKMAAQHEEWVIELLGGLAPEEVNRLSTLLAKVKSTVTNVVKES